MHVYRIKSKTSGKSYVGQTRNTVARRWYDHCWRASQKKTVFAKAISKYGADDFEVTTLNSGPIDTADAREIAAIAEFHCLIPSGYNQLAGGRGAYDVKQSTRDKLSIILKNRKVTASARAKSSATKTGKPINSRPTQDHNGDNLPKYINRKGCGYSVKMNQLRRSFQSIALTMDEKLQLAKACLHQWQQTGHAPRVKKLKLHCPYSKGLPVGVCKYHRITKLGVVQEGYCVTTLKPRKYWISAKWTMEEKLQLAMDYLNKMQAGLIEG